MKLGGKEVSGSFGTTIVLLSPLWINGIMLVAIAAGHDLFYFTGEVPIALGLCAPAAYLLLRWLVPTIAARVGAPFAAAADAAD